MKKQILITLIAIIFCVGGVAAQKGEMKKMEMEGMQKNPNHELMMAYRENAHNFAAALRDMGETGMLTDVEAARLAFAEIKRSVEKMDNIHQSQMDKMTPEMMLKMKPMMQKMQTEQNAVKEDIAKLETALQAVMPNAKEVETHAAALAAQFGRMGMMDEKMKMKDKKMKMSDKPKM